MNWVPKPVLASGLLSLFLTSPLSCITQTSIQKSNGDVHSWIWKQWLCAPVCHYAAESQTYGHGNRGSFTAMACKSNLWAVWASPARTKYWVSTSLGKLPAMVHYFTINISCLMSHIQTLVIPVLQYTIKPSGNFERRKELKRGQVVAKVLEV